MSRALSRPSGNPSAKTVCESCAVAMKTLLRDIATHSSSKRWDLQNSKDMWKSAEKGCLGCKFFWAVCVLDFANYQEVEVLKQRENRICIIQNYDYGFLVKTDASQALQSGKACINFCLVAAELQDDYVVGLRQSGNHLVTIRRPIPKILVDGDALNIASIWLRACSLHSECGSQSEVSLPTRVIEIPARSDLRPKLHITEPGEKGCYIALSHCWGCGIKFRTDRSNLRTLQGGFDSEKMPRSFQDAIAIAKRLGFKFLWIDAICIVQDDAEDWARESALMTQVYRKATLMISANAAPDSDHGMLRERSVLRSHAFGPEEEFIWQTASEFTNPYERDGIPPLDTRAWAYQERTMAPRILHFKEEEMVWECANCMYSEDCGLTQINLLEGRQIEQRRKIQACFPDERMDKEPQNINERLSLWYDCVSEYARRDLTYPADVLPAFSGLAAAMRVPELGEYLAGLWESDFAFGLTWQGNIDKKDVSDAEYIGPSWSWASHFKNVDENYDVDNCDLYRFKRSWRPGMQDSSIKLRLKYDAWAAVFKPQLLSFHIDLATADLHGKILNGCLSLRAFSRPILLYPHISQKQRYLFQGEHNRHMQLSWQEIWLDGHQKSQAWNFSAPNEWPHWQHREDDEVCHYIAVQIEQTRLHEKASDLCTIFLILERVDGEKNVFRRVGILDFKLPDDQMVLEMWEDKDIKMI